MIRTVLHLEETGWHLPSYSVGELEDAIARLSQLQRTVEVSNIAIKIQELQKELKFRRFQGFANDRELLQALLDGRAITNAEGRLAHMNESGTLVGFERNLYDRIIPENWRLADI